ncbi:hypothetical protein AVEN_92916-1 [Araneus ventricosus]|uniref:Uncharacterized protein n=1 Tax=Araneus ventricosus TaxID=182803 RepID=A0A4Y2D2A2_ARAVE|nr:hypothetical protein AVEN_92916-1 [Araneus ventricosus]
MDLSFSFHRTPSCSNEVLKGSKQIYSQINTTEYVDLTPNTRTERIYESLGDCKEYTYENVIHKSHFPPSQTVHSHHPIPSIVTR